MNDDALSTVVFDLDGTLVHSLFGLTLSLNRLLARLGRAPLPEAAVRRMVGEGAAKLVERAMGASGGPPVGDPSGLVAEFLAFYEHDALTHTTAFAGSAAVLAALAEAGHRLALCTNKPQAPTEAVLATLGLAGHFRAVLGGDALPFHKPDPRHLLASIAAAGGRRDRAVLVGDSPIDAQAGQAAGVPVILVRHGYSRQPLEELGADAIIDDLTGLLAILAP